MGVPLLPAAHAESGGVGSSGNPTASSRGFLASMPPKATGGPARRAGKRGSPVRFTAPRPVENSVYQDLTLDLGSPPRQPLASASASRASAPALAPPARAAPMDLASPTPARTGLSSPTTPHSRELRQCMEQMGLTEAEQSALWLGGVDTVQWLEEGLRPEDFRAASIDTQSRAEQAHAARVLRQARADEDQSRQIALVRARADVGADHVSPLRLAAIELEERRQAVQEAERASEAATEVAEAAAAQLVRANRDSAAHAEQQKDALAKAVRGGAREFDTQRSLQCGQLSEPGLHKVLAAVHSLEQLCALDLDAMRALGLCLTDCRLLDSIRQRAADGVLPRGPGSSAQALASAESRLAQLRAEHRELERENADLKSAERRLSQEALSARADMEREIAELRARNQHLAQEVQEARTEARAGHGRADLESEVAELRASNRRLEQGAEDANVYATTLQAQVESALQRAAQAEEASASLERQLQARAEPLVDHGRAALETENAELRLANQRLREEVQGARSKAQSDERRMAELAAARTPQPQPEPEQADSSNEVDEPARDVETRPDRRKDFLERGQSGGGSFSFSRAKEGKDKDWAEMTPQESAAAQVSLPPPLFCGLPVAAVQSQGSLGCATDRLHPPCKASFGCATDLAADLCPQELGWDRHRWDNDVTPNAYDRPW